MIEAVFFDVDETLVDSDSAARRAHVDVDACLAALRRRDLVLGVITNNDSDHQRRKLARSAWPISSMSS